MKSTVDKVNYLNTLYIYIYIYIYRHILMKAAILCIYRNIGISESIGQLTKTLFTTRLE